MTAKIIVICNEKGGCGKTTVAMQLAGGLAENRKKVLVIDADRQGSALQWKTAAPDNTPFPAKVVNLAAAGNKLHREIQDHMNDFDVILVDCPPSADSPISASALLVADLALLPIIPSPSDLWAARGIGPLIEMASARNATLQAHLVINMLQPRTSLAQSIIEVIDELGIPVLKSRLTLRSAFRESTLVGGTVFSVRPRNTAAITEVKNLTKEVLSLLKKGK